MSLAIIFVKFAMFGPTEGLYLHKHTQACIALVSYIWPLINMVLYREVGGIDMSSATTLGTNQNVQPPDDVLKHRELLYSE